MGDNRSCALLGRTLAFLSGFQAGLKMVVVFFRCLALTPYSATELAVHAEFPGRPGDVMRRNEIEELPQDGYLRSR